MLELFFFLMFVLDADAGFNFLTLCYYFKFFKKI